MSKEKRDVHGRPYIGVLFTCCRIYARMYKNKAGTAYVGWCPRCTAKLEVKCGSGGTDQRIFRTQ